MGKRRNIELVFDENKRRKFLTGFRARKQERIKKARDKLEKDLKEERKRIKQETKEGFKNKLKKTFSVIPELTEELEEEEYDTENVSVQIVELPTEQLVKSWQKQRAENNTETSTNGNMSVEATPVPEIDEIPGMGFQVKPKKIQKNDDDENKDNQKTMPLKKEFKSKKDLMKTLNKGSIRELKGSKAFQMKKKLEQKKDRKKARMDKARKGKTQKKVAGKNVKASKKKTRKNKRR